MKRTLMIAASALLVAGMAGLMPAHAANHDVTVGGGASAFSPAGLIAAAGDTVTWHWATGPHDVAAYSGDSFASPLKYAGDTYSVTFGGGTVRYHCTLHGFLDGYGHCQGMCGVLTDQTIDVTPPVVTIATPQNNGVALSPVNFSGTATDNVGVDLVTLRITDLFGTYQDHIAGCTCPGTSVNWSKQVNLFPGIYRVTVWAIDAGSNLGQMSSGFIAV